jgi:CheY-like chemotaxis protein
VAQGTQRAEADDMATVLVVNDDPEMLDLYEALLEEMGHRAVPRKDLEPQPETVINLGADGLVIDLQAEEDAESGLHVIESLRSHPATSNLPVILCTGAVAEAHEVRRRLEDLRVPLLIKPFPVERFREVVSELLPSG